MRFLLYLVLIPVALGVGAYFYAFLRRMLKTFLGEKHPLFQHKALKPVLATLSLVIGFISIHITGMGAVIILHIFLFDLLFRLLHAIVAAFGEKKSSKVYRVWRSVQGSGVLPILLTAVLLIFGYCNLQNVTKTAYTVYTEKGLREEGYRIALLADIHYGVSLDDAQLRALCDEISTENPDLVILCGDIVDDRTPKGGVEEVFAALGGIQSRYGIYYVYGNHDRPMQRLYSAYTESELISVLSKNGITTLQDEVLEIEEDLVLVGREDNSYGQGGSGRASIEFLLAEVNPQVFCLTLDHQPIDYAANGKAGTDLLLSGHTHGGQLWPLNYLQEWIPFNDAVYGLTEIDSDTSAIVTSGVAGWCYPVKTAAPAEYVMIDILPS